LSKYLLFANTDWFLYNFRLASAEALRARGDEVVLVSPPGKYAASLQERGFRWREFPFARRGMNPLSEAGTLLRLARLYRQERPVLAHHFTVKCVLYGTLAARFAGIRPVVNSLTGLGYVFTGERGLLRDGISAAYRLLMRRTWTIFENPDDQKMFIQRNWIVPARSAVILGAGVDVERFHPQAEPPTGEPVVIFPARILWDKGIGEFVGAARRLRGKNLPARFVVVGESDAGNPTSVPLRTLEDWKREGIVEWWGWQEDMQKVYAQAHIACLPSHREGLSNALAEACACGLPIVTTDVPGCRDVVTHGLNGLLAPVKNASALAEALETLLSDPELRRAMGAAGREIAVNKFGVTKINAETLALYEKVLADAGSR